jgi:hypothetical protein
VHPAAQDYSQLFCCEWLIKTMPDPEGIEYEFPLTMRTHRTCVYQPWNYYQASRMKVKRPATIVASSRTTANYFCCEWLIKTMPDPEGIEFE